MSRVIIAGNPKITRDIPREPYIDIAEFFCDTIQGEGINTGVPSTFLRVQGCIANCHWCDTTEVWRYGNPYSITELLDMMEDHDVIRILREGQHLVLTGGSPLMQQASLIQFLMTFEKRFEFSPYIEIENECMIMPDPALVDLINCWNNSPKLSNSGNATGLRYQPEILKTMSSLENSWFKFVVAGEYDWQEIEKNYLEPELILREQIILMPLGASREELQKTREKTVDMAIKQNVRYCTREHVVLWNKATGV